MIRTPPNSFSMTNCGIVRNTIIICAAFWRKVIDSHSGMSSLGRLYGFLPLTIASEDELEFAEDELMAIADDKLVAGEKFAVSLKGLIWFFVFCSRDSVNEFIGVNCLSNKFSALVSENAPKNAMINRILRCMLAGFYCHRIFSLDPSPSALDDASPQLSFRTGGV